MPQTFWSVTAGAFGRCRCRRTALNPRSAFAIGSKAGTTTSRKRRSRTVAEGGEAYEASFLLAIGAAIPLYAYAITRGWVGEDRLRHETQIRPIGTQVRGPRTAHRADNLRHRHHHPVHWRGRTVRREENVARGPHREHPGGRSSRLSLEAAADRDSSNGNVGQEFDALDDGQQAALARWIRDCMEEAGLKVVEGRRGAGRVPLGVLAAMLRSVGHVE